MNELQKQDVVNDLRSRRRRLASELASIEAKVAVRTPSSCFTTCAKLLVQSTREAVTAIEREKRNVVSQNEEIQRTLGTQLRQLGLVEHEAHEVGNNKDCPFG